MTFEKLFVVFAK